MKKRFYQKGFTMIELLIVVAIVTILAATALPQIRDMRERSQKARVSALIAQIETQKARAFTEQELSPGSTVQFNQIKQYLMINGRQPQSIDDLSVGRYTINTLGTYPDVNGIASPVVYNNFP